MTDKRIKEILNSMTIIEDSREQVNDIILKHFNTQGIKHIKRKLEYGDYSFAVNIPELGPEPISFETKIAVEKKNSLEEISGNFSNGRENFKEEFQRAADDKAKLIIMIEQTLPKELNGIYKKIINAVDKENKPLLKPAELETLNKCITGIGSYKDIVNHNYDTNMTPNSFEASLLAFNLRYNTNTWFVPKKLSGQFIYNVFESFLKIELKQLEMV